MTPVIDSKLTRLGNTLVLAMAVILTGIIIVVAQMATAANAAIPLQQSVDIELTPMAQAPARETTAIRNSLQ
jgi:hypothetical protein